MIETIIGDGYMPLQDAPCTCTGTSHICPDCPTDELAVELCDLREALSEAMEQAGDVARLLTLHGSEEEAEYCDQMISTLASFANGIMRIEMQREGRKHQKIGA